MHRRIRNIGGKFYLNPQIKCIYYSRNSIKDMFKQGFWNGYWNIVTFQKDKKSLSIRHLVPLCFVCGMLGCAILALFKEYFLNILLGILCMHILLGICFAIKKSKKISHILVLPFLFMGLHVSYGVGSLYSILCILFSRKRRKNETTL